MTHTFSLNDDRAIPALGLGTWQVNEDDAYRAVRAAIAAGYRHIDCAWVYGNERAIGKALAECIDGGEVERRDLFITSKLWNHFHAPSDVETGFRESLAALRLDYVDLYLMHWPIAFRPGTEFPDGRDDLVPLKELPLEDTFQAMLNLREKGLTKSVGVSNFSASKLERIRRSVGVVPTVNQVELHPYNPQESLRAYCAENSIHLTAYSPLGSSETPNLLEDAELREAAESEGLSPAQLLISWGIERGTSVIPRSTSEEHIRENIAHLPHAMSEDAMELIDGLDTRKRFVNPSQMFAAGITHDEGKDFWD